MEIRVLRYFLAVAKTGNITNAANALHLTQPTLSRQIKELEEQLGQALLVRKSHHVSLTPAGVLFRKRAEEIISMVDKTHAEFKTMQDTVSGDIYIGGGETDAIRRIAEILKSLRERYPGIHVHLYSGNSTDVTERLDKGLLDFGLLIDPADLTRYDSLRLPDRDRWGVVMRKDSPLAAKTSIRKDDLFGLPLICSRQAMAADSDSNDFVAWFGDDFDKLDIVTTFNLIYNANIMVESGIGYALSIDKLTNTSAGSPLCFRPLSPALESGLNIVWKKEQVFSAASALLLQEMRAAFA